MDRVPSRRFNVGLSPGDAGTEALYAQLEELASTAPSVAAAWSLAGVLSRRAVPINADTLTPTGPELPIGDAALPMILERWFERPRDGVGVVLGEREVCLLTKPGARWGEFLNEHVRFTSRKIVSDPDQDERIVESPDQRAIGSPVLIAWSPPAAGSHVRSTGVFRGSGPVLKRQLAELFAPAGSNEATSAGWRVWTAAEPVKLGRRQVAAGMTALGPGQVIPWHCARRDGWVLQSIRPGGLDHPDWWAPPWLVEFLVRGKRPPASPKPPADAAAGVNIW